MVAKRRAVARDGPEHHFWAACVRTRHLAKTSQPSSHGTKIGSHLQAVGMVCVRAGVVASGFGTILWSATILVRCKRPTNVSWAVTYSSTTKRNALYQPWCSAPTSTNDSLGSQQGEACLDGQPATLPLAMCGPSET